ncbi:MAG: LysR family transcriptional regulator, partial [Chloroflexota bacterium]
MNLRQLRYFYWVSKQGSYARAADELGVTEPCVYRAVRSLERSCGVQLLAARKGRVTATHAGRILHDYAQRIEALHTEAEYSLAELVTPRQGCLVFGTTHPFALALTPHLASWKSVEPKTRLSIVLDKSIDLYASLLEGQLDVALAPVLSLPAGLYSDERVFYSDLVFAGPPGHPLSLRRVVSPAEVLEEQLITTFAATVNYDVLTGISEELNSRLNVSMQVDDPVLMVELVAAGAGIGLVSKYLASEAVRQGRLSIIN